MSFNIEAVRRYYQDPLLQLIREMSKRIAKQESENVEIETDDITGLGDYDHSYVRYDDRWNFHKKFTLPETNPQLPMEPDYEHLVLDLKFDHMGNTLTDYSGFNNHAEIYGEPCPASGIALPYRGGYMKSQAHSMASTDGVKYVIETTPDLKIEEQVTGFSMWFVFNLSELPTESKYLYWNYNDSNNGIAVKIEDGDFKFIVNNAGTLTKKRTDGTILPNTNYEIVVTHTLSGNVSKIYQNNVEQTIVNSTDIIEDPSNNDVTIGRELDFNFLQHLRFYKSYVISAAQVGYLYNNKFTVSNITAGNVLITDGCVLGLTPALVSFSSESFSDASFTT